MKEAVIVGYLRTPISRSRPTDPERDVFYRIRADELAAMLIEELVKRTGVRPKEIGDCLIGCANQSGEQWTYGGKTVSLMGRLPFEVPSMSIDRQCASAMSAIHIGAMEIACGITDVVIAGGMEHMTRVPMGQGVSPSEKLLRDDRFDVMTAVNMGLTAEKLFEECKDIITKEDMDRWSLRSHQLATKAQAEGFFKGEILPVKVTMPDGTEKIIDSDQSIRPDTSYEKIAYLPPAFKPDGFITAGNSSPLNAGAAMMMLMSKEKAREYGLEPMATIRSMGWAGVDPTVMGKGPVPASEKALANAGLRVEDIDFWEINEAFAIVTLYTIKKLGIDPEKVNVKGGAIAIGHPLGMTGTRLVGTLARILNLEKARYGLATVCVGGGQGAATIIERE